jgi:FKBP-type peptidyl-prolyl cis-trans isomerase SlyD
MQVAEKKVISLHYTLTNTSGNVLDSSTAEDPLVYLHGAGNIIPGLENALTDKSVGDKLNVTIAPEDAYGIRTENMIETVPRDMFQGIDQIEPGMQFHAQGGAGPVTVTVVNVTDDEVTIDGNHPLAGETLIFDVEITDIREATTDELEHGHIHGKGCQHD